MGQQELSWECVYIVAVDVDVVIVVVAAVAVVVAVVVTQSTVRRTFYQLPTSGSECTD